MMSVLAAIVLASTVHFAGDSTLDECGRKFHQVPYASWGTQLEQWMTAGNKVRNLAACGRSTKSFENEGRWAKLIGGVNDGDYVIIQFGHNDQKHGNEKDRKERWADPKTTYRENIRRWVAQVRAKGATPILCSPIRRGSFDKAGKKLTDGKDRDGICLGSYREAMAELSVELKCDYVDMNTLTKNHLEEIGREKAMKYFVYSTRYTKGKDGEPDRDTTHPINTGARAFAKLFLADARRQQLAIAKLFDKQDFKLTDFGAKPNGNEKCTMAFKRAFEAAATAGGGRIVVPSGKYMTGAIHFKNNCELHLEEGAEIVFSQEAQDYLPAVHTSWEGMECYNYSPLVYAYGCTNVAITGKGTLIGYEGEWQKSKWFPWVPQTNGIKAARRTLYDWGAKDVPMRERQIWKQPKAHTRPQLVQFNRCYGVTLDGFKIRNSPFWTIHIYMCDQTYVNGLDVYAHGNNNDGIDVEMSANTFVENCRFNQGDDGVVIKAGRNRDAWRLHTPTYGVFVRDCEFVDAHTLLGIGSELSGGVKNVTMLDCTIADVQNLIYLKTNRRRGGVIEDIRVEGVKGGKAKGSVFAIATNILYEWAEFPTYEERLTKFRNIRIKDAHCDSAKRRVTIKGEKEMPIEGVVLKNVTADKVAKADVIENATVEE